MGVDVQFYTVYGIKLSYDECEEIIEELYESNLECVVDGMMGEYVVLGSILSSFYAYGDEEQFTEMNVSNLEELKTKYKEKFNIMFPESKHLIEGEWKILTFVHYS